MTSQDPGIELECEDLDAALSDKSVSVRSAACRDLSKVGTPDRLAQLITMAGGDKSPAVRLGTASAAADILSRHRLGAAREAIDDAGRAELLRAMNRVDPGVNAGLFPMLACLDVPQSLGRILVGLRDPRRGVRIGAAVGLLRHVSCVGKAGDEAIETALLAGFSDKRLPPDALAELSRICAATGLGAALPAMEALDLGGTLQELVDAAIEMLRKAGQPPIGVWVGDGLDAGEVNPAAVQPAVLVVAPSGAWTRQPGGAWTAAPGALQRRMWLRRSGAPEPVAALQWGGGTWYAPTGDQLEQSLGLAELEVPAALLDAAGVEAVLGALPDDRDGQRLRGIVALALGAGAAAEACFDAVLSEKKPPADVRTLRAMAIEADRGAEAAAEAWAEAHKKARPKSAWYGKRAKAALDR